MAYIPINNSQIQVGKAVRKELWQITKDNLDDLDERSTALESVTQKIQIYNETVFGLGQLGGTTSIGVIHTIRAPLDLNIIQAQFEVIRAGESGSTTMDVLIGPNIDSLVSIFSQKPIVSFSDGNNYQSINQIIATSEVDEGQMIAVKFDTIQIGMGPIAINILGEPR